MDRGGGEGGRNPGKTPFDPKLPPRQESPELLKTVLIVDNSPVMRRVIERSLRLAGLEGARILDAGDGAEALELARQQSVDLVLTELDLPTMSGLDLLRQLRAEAATGDLPVLIVSSNSAQSLVLESLRLGAAGFLRKPFTIDQMKEYAIPLLHPPRFA